MLVSMELIMNGAGLNLVALNRFISPENVYGMAFTLIIMGLAAAEASLALGIIILIFRKYGHIEGGELKEMKD
jgi:NADH:ubiquinone oxidoreductase subunit K